MPLSVVPLPLRSTRASQCLASLSTQRAYHLAAGAVAGKAGSALSVEKRSLGAPASWLASAAGADMVSSTSSIAELKLTSDSVAWAEGLKGWLSLTRGCHGR